MASYQHQYFECDVECDFGGWQEEVREERLLKYQLESVTLITGSAERPKGLTPRYL